ncbi:MAG: CvpA family protein [Chloroflexi bacterium]|nr:MAG: CvpA family protein [Chloroflexota bacterium]TMB96264.1 MAG: CvpA family protein [Chloroflexota bacterium]TMC26433.1 MAG: CvpA family protein [Chloroflexota bacterium]TMC34744.1 MAG: CvpA family protein [Chloroflexota bacterium]TMC58051.1 MAG: CvpA family protein [Chloroflexota bacterium]
MFDITILAIVGIAAVAGWRKGFVAPLFAVALSVLGLYALYNGPGAGLVPTGTIGLGLGVLVVGFVASVVGRVAGMLVSLVHRVGLLRAADHTLGLPLGALTGLVAVYLALVAVVSFDNLLAPFHGKLTVDQAAVAALKVALDANPQFAVMIDPGMVDAMATQVAKAAIPADQIQKFDQTLGYYETTVRPQLISSALAPVILAVGERAPFLGRHIVFPEK